MAVTKKTSQVNRISPNGQAEASAHEGIIIEPIAPSIVIIPVVGLTPLLVCAWSQKAMQMMLDKQMKKAKRGREAKDPQADYLASRYISTDGWDGCPAAGVKGALVNACRAVDGLPMTLAKRMLFVRGQGVDKKDGRALVKIEGEPKLHQAMVRLETGVADVRFRAIYEKWALTLEIEFLSSVISAEQVANLVELAGWIEGLHEHRPGSPKSCTGDNGRFQIKRDEMEVVGAKK